ncbi:MAG: hypothetical protein WBM50_24395 [Acidimicrobiales bacterium]
MNVKRYAMLVAALALVAAACSSDDASSDATAESETTEAPTTTAAPGEASGTGTGIALATSDLGDIIVDGDGNTMYLFVPDAQGDSTCYDECEAAWPIVAEVTDVGDGLDASLLGTTERTNGDVQATYNGWPLYYFANDAAVGDTNGQGLNDVWYVLDATGTAIGG